MRFAIELLRAASVGHKVEPSEAFRDSNVASRSATRKAAEKRATIRPPREMASAQAILPEASEARPMFAGRFAPAGLEEELYRVPKWSRRRCRVHARAAKMRNAFRGEAHTGKIFETPAPPKKPC